MPDGEIDPETGAITATWEATGATSVPPWVGVEYSWYLWDESGNEFQTEIALAEYEDNLKDRARHESDEVIVFSLGLQDDIGELVVEAMDAQRQKYIDGWGGPLPYRPRVILFGGFDDWLEWQIGHIVTTFLGSVNVGLTSGLWDGTVQVLYGPPEELAYGTVLHEIEHLYQNEYLARRVKWMPGWFTEGDTGFYQLDEYMPDYATMENRWLFAKTLDGLI